MSTAGSTNGMSVCAGCGAEVVIVAVQIGEAPTVSTSLWGAPMPFERLMARTDGALRIVQHLCRDYLVWHQPVDRRDPDLLDVAA